MTVAEQVGDAILEAAPMGAPVERQGLVVRVEGIACTVLLPDGERRRARLTGKVLRNRVATAPVAIGDQVTTRPMDDQFDQVAALLPRRGELVRAPSGGGVLKQVIAANLDLLVVVVACQQPPPNSAGVDRLLLIAEQAGCAALLVMNKADLAATPGEVDDFLEPYRRAGYETLAVSARDSQGVDRLRACLTGRISAVVGPSGAGKSTLLGAVQPGLRLKSGELTRAGKGRHTTTVADLLSLEGGGFVADTPGLKEVAPWGLTRDGLAVLFREFRPFLGECRYVGCQHLNERDCAVAEAVANGTIAAARYESYRKLHTELLPPPHGRRQQGR